MAGDASGSSPGDQVVADGAVIAARGLTLDESILTGESDAVAKEAGDPVLSGAYCLAGSGDYLVEAVGADSFAERLAVEARAGRARRSARSSRTSTASCGSRSPRWCRWPCS